MSEWHFVLNGEKVGPVEDETLKEKISSGEIKGDTHLLKKGWACWTPAHQTDIYKTTLGIVDTPPEQDSAENASSFIITSTGEISIKEAFTFGWNTTKPNLGFLIPVTLIFFLAPYVPAILGMFAGGSGIVLSLVGLLAIAISLLVQMGLIKIALKYTAGQKPEYDDLINTYPLIPQYLGASIICIILVSIGMVLLVIPGIIIGLVLQFFTFIILDKKLGAIDSLKKSYAIAKGNWLNIFLFNLLFGLVNCAGALCLGIGMLISIPVSMIAYAHFYRQLIGKEALSQPKETATDDITPDVVEKPPVETKTEEPPKPAEEPTVVQTPATPPPEPELTIEPEPEVSIEPEPGIAPEEEDLSDIDLDDISFEDDTELTVIDDEQPPEPEIEIEPEAPVEPESKPEPEPTPEPEEPTEPKKPLKFQFSDSKKDSDETSGNEDDTN